jgi:exopolysaccharide biosynthesis polyprenyl glycosylphosphotransferase
MSGGSPASFDAGQQDDSAAPLALATVRETPDKSLRESRGRSVRTLQSVSELVESLTQEVGEPVAGQPLIEPVLGHLQEPPYSAPLARSSRWRGAYQSAAVVTDLTAAICAMLAAFGLRFGAAVGGFEPVPLAILLLFPVAWIAVVALSRAYEVRVLGAGAIEYERLGKAFLLLTAMVTFTAYATHSDLSRGFVLLALPATLMLSVAFRYGLRKVVRHRRRAGQALIPVLAVGAPDAIAAFSDTLLRNAHNGLRVRAACVVSTESDADALVDKAATVTDLDERAIPVCGDVDSIREAVRETGVTTVAVVDNRISADRLRWISWQLEGMDTDLVVLPALTEVAGRRLSIQQVGALPLLYVAEPELHGLRRLVKSCFDRLSAALLLILFTPLLVFVGLAVRATSSGPALFFQTRVGRNGKPFRMIKFRSMVDNAEAQLASLQVYNEVEGGTLFKIKADPRITRIGQVIRRFSIDEIPQLFNVLTGSMSLVGPRPQLPAEVEQYGGDVRRRLLVKPGMTGLWQISGRSQLTWEESVRIDLRYVENWSLSLDLLVLIKTFGAVVHPKGAY